MVVEEQRNQQLQSLIGMAFTTGGFEASQNLVQLNNGCYLPEFVNQPTPAMQTSSNYLYNYNNIPPPTQPTLTAQPETLESEVKENAPSIEELAVVQPLQPLQINDDRNEKDTKLLQLSRLKGELYEKLVEQQKYFFKLHTPNYRLLMFELLIFMYKLLLFKPGLSGIPK